MGRLVIEGGAGESTDVETSNMNGMLDQVEVISQAEADEEASVSRKY